MENKKRRIITLLVILLLGISIGYAALSTTLNINGSSHINNATWNVYWDNVQVIDGSVPADTPVIDNSKTTVSYDVTLNQPGDFYEFTVDAKNAGSIDAMIETITSKLNGTVITSSNLPVYIDYNVTYANGNPIVDNQLLEAGTTLTYKIRIEYKREIESSQLPTSPQVLNFSIGATYIQKTGNAIPVTNGITVYTAMYLNDEHFIYIGSSIPSGVALFNNAEDAFNHRKQINGRPFSYVATQHTLVNDIVTESYVVFIITSETASTCTGASPGIYSLKGEIDESSLTNQPIYEANKSILVAAFGNNRCSEDEYGMECYCPTMWGGASNIGYVFMNDNYGGCGVWNRTGCDGVYEF